MAEWIVIGVALCAFSGAWRLVPAALIVEAVVFHRWSRWIVRLVYGRSARFRHWYVVHATRRLTRAFARTNVAVGRSLLPAAVYATARVAEFGRRLAK